MNNGTRVCSVFAFVALGLSVAIGSRAANSQPAPKALAPPPFTAEQAARGKAIYLANCAECHGKDLDDGEFATPLRGPVFGHRWGASSLDKPFTIMITQMPPTNPGSLPHQSYVDALAYILSQNGAQPNPNTELPGDMAELRTMAVPYVDE